MGYCTWKSLDLRYEGWYIRPEVGLVYETLLCSFIGGIFEYLCGFD